LSLPHGKKRVGLCIDSLDYSYPIEQTAECFLSLFASIIGKTTLHIKLLTQVFTNEQIIQPRNPLHMLYFSINLQETIFEPK
jgi:hypothetical protein